MRLRNYLLALKNRARYYYLRSRYSIHTASQKIRYDLKYKKHILPGGFERIYHVHIRKTAGTSLNFAVWSLDGGDPMDIQKNIYRETVWSHGNKIYVGSRIDLINRGKYFFGRSHLPLHKLSLPPETFTIAIFRDPAARVISHYKMLLDYREDPANHAPFDLTQEMPWIGSSFREFLDNIPKTHLLNQLYMFSEKMDVQEAYEVIMEQCTCFMNTEDFSTALNSLADVLHLPLQEYHRHKSKTPTEITENDFSDLHDLLADEYRLIAMLKQQIDPLTKLYLDKKSFLNHP